MEGSNLNRGTGRQPGLDLIRVFASLSVVAVHFYLNCNYYQTPLVGGKMFIMTVGRWFFMVCVPLFMMLTGYLKINKTFCAAHFKSLIPIGFSYVLIAILKVLISNLYYGKGYYSLWTAFKAIATYQIAWYVGMYVGLTLLIPFLNQLWEALDDSMRKYLLLILLLVCCVPSLIPFVVPSYWQMLYPIFYYYAGAYIRTYRPKINALWLIAAILGATGAGSVISFVSGQGALFDWNVLAGVDSGYPALPVAIATVSMFLLLYQVEVLSGGMAKILQTVSSVSLEVYLFTGVFDVVIFSLLKNQLHYEMATEFFWWFAVTVPVNFLLSVCCGLGVKKLYELGNGLVIRGNK